MVWVRLPVYFYKRNDTFYFSRSIPSDLQHRFKKRKIEVSLRTKSESKAAKSAAALSDRLERYWDSLRMEMIYSRELGLKVLRDTKRPNGNLFSLSDELALYHRIKGNGKSRWLASHFGPPGGLLHHHQRLRFQDTAMTRSVIQTQQVQR